MPSRPPVALLAVSHLRRCWHRYNRGRRSEVSTPATRDGLPRRNRESPQQRAPVAALAGGPCDKGLARRRAFAPLQSVGSLSNGEEVDSDLLVPTSSPFARNSDCLLGESPRFQSIASLAYVESSPYASESSLALYSTHLKRSLSLLSTRSSRGGCKAMKYEAIRTSLRAILRAESTSFSLQSPLTPNVT